MEPVHHEGHDDHLPLEHFEPVHFLLDNVQPVHLGGPDDHLPPDQV